MPMETCRKCPRNLVCRCDSENRRRRASVANVPRSFPAEKRPKNEVGDGRGGRGAICTTSRQKWAMAEYKTKGQGSSQRPRPEVPERNSSSEIEARSSVKDGSKHRGQKMAKHIIEYLTNAERTLKTTRMSLRESRGDVELWNRATRRLFNSPLRPHCRRPFLWASKRHKTSQWR